MAIDFPNSPSNNDEFTVGTTTWKYNGTAWVVVISQSEATIETGAVTTAKILDANVTAAKLASGAAVTNIGYTPANIASPTFTGTPTLPTGTIATTQTAGNNTTALATTAFVTAAITTPKIYVAKYTTYTNNSWTCPAGVTQIKLTLIGAGGASGDAAATTAFSSSSIGSPANTAGSTTFTVGGTVYTALGGKKGADVSITGDSFEMTGTYVGISSGSSSSAGTGNDFSRYPGCGGAPTSAFASTQRTFSDDDGFASHTSRAYALAYRGQDGVTEVFQVTVVPGTAYSFSIGLGAGFAGYLTTDSNMGSNGAVIIEYVV